jgi:hypothetical protein
MPTTEVSMKLLHVAGAVTALTIALPVSAEEIIRGYVTQIEVNSAVKEIRVWVAPERRMKGSRDLLLDPADPMLRHQIELARVALDRRLPVKLHLDANRKIASFILRRYPSTRQLQK